MTPPSPGLKRYLEARLLLCFAAAFVGGVAAGPFAAAAVVAPIILRSRRRSLYAAILLGALLGWLRPTGPPDPAAEEDECLLTGRIVDEPSIREAGRRELAGADDAEAPCSCRFTVRADVGLVQVYRLGPLEEIRRGDRVRVRGALAPPRGPRNPGQADWAVKLRRDGVVGVLRSYHPRDEFAVEPGFHILRPVDLLRAKLRERFFEIMDPEAAGLLTALTLGYRDGLPRDLVRGLQRSGTAHFLAISGLHLGLVFAMLVGATLLAGLRGRAQKWTILAGLFLFTLLTGMNVAVLRAFTMIAVHLLGGLLFRRSDPPTSLAAAALIIVGLDPAAIHEASFQLSFLAVLGIFWIGPIFHDFLGRPVRLASFFAVSLAAWLATAPVIQGTFHIVTPLVVLANLVFWPFIALLIGLALLILLLSWTPLAAPLGYAAGLLVSALGGASGATEHLAPVSYFYSPGPAAALLALYYAALASWATWCRLCPSVRRALLCAPLAALLTVPLLHRERVEAPFFAQLDVGRGLCTYVEFPDGRNFVFDAGSLDYRDPGASVLAPYLWSRGVRQVDTLFISHDDADHADGAQTLVERLGVRKVVSTPYAELPDFGGDVEVLRVRVEGDRPVRLTDEIQVLSPPVWEETGGPPSSNESSLILRVAGKLLLTGDAKDLAMERLLARDWDLKVDVLASPHHGKRYNLHQDLAHRTGASVLVVSAPEGYHDAQTVEGFEGKVLITGKEGAVEILLSSPLRSRSFRRHD